MKTVTLAECMAALRWMDDADTTLQSALEGTRWEHDPRVLAFWAQASEVVAVIREAHAKAVRSAAP